MKYGPVTLVMNVDNPNSGTTFTSEKLCQCTVQSLQSLHCTVHYRKDIQR